MGLLIDSSVLIEIERRGLTLAAIQSAASGTEPLGISAITASELLVGLYLGAPAYQRARAEFVEIVFDRLPVFSFDLHVARLHAEVWSRLRRSGELINRHDLMIATTALAYSFGVLTYNIRDFDRVPGLEVRRPNW